MRADDKGLETACTSQGARTEWSQLPLTSAPGAGHATDEAHCEWPSSRARERSSAGALATAASIPPPPPFRRFLAEAPRAASSSPLAATASLAASAPAAISQAGSTP